MLWIHFNRFLMDTNAVINAVLLTVIIPFMGLMWRRNERTQERNTESLGKLNDSFVDHTLAFNRFAAVIVGLEGQGGALVQISEMQKLVYKLQIQMTAVLIQTGVKVPSRSSDFD